MCRPPGSVISLRDRSARERSIANAESFSDGPIADAGGERRGDAGDEAIGAGVHAAKQFQWRGSGDCSQQGGRMLRTPGADAARSRTGRSNRAARAAGYPTVKAYITPIAPSDFFNAAKQSASIAVPTPSCMIRSASPTVIAAR